MAISAWFENHRGFIDVESESGKGTTVSLFFSVAEATPPAVDETIKRESRQLLGMTGPLAASPKAQS